jgi:multisubunit Na+/H+ antiporter MnhB subunit
MSDFENGQFVGATSAYIKCGTLFLVVSSVVGWNSFIWSESGNEFLTPFILNNDLNMGSTFNMYSSLDFLNLLRWINSVSTVSAAVIVSSQVIRM